MRALALALLAACGQSSTERAELELDIGKAEIAAATIRVDDGLAAVRDLSDGRLEVWCNAPVIDFDFDLPDAGSWTLIANNVLVDSILLVDHDPHVRDPGGDRGTVATFTLSLAAGHHRLHIGPPDAVTVAPFRIVAMADIQTALPIVNQVFEKISAVENARFVVMMGDITERGEIDEYELFEKQLLTLSIPIFTTVGNHELWGPAERYFNRFGRASYHFEFKGTAFTFVDSGGAALDPLVSGWLDGWLDKAIEQPHIFLTHIPPIDPVGLRYGAFASYEEGHRLLERLAAGKVDLMLYGHIHTLIEYEDAGIPAYISGGGGALPMKGDGIDRHFLVIDCDGPTQTVDVVRVDP